MHTIHVIPGNETVHVDENTSIGRALKNAGYPIESGCAEYGYCADCMIVVEEGADSLTPPTYDERRILGALFHAPKYRDEKPLRLACQSRLLGDVTVNITKHIEEQARNQVRKEATNGAEATATQPDLVPVASLARRGPRSAGRES